MTDRWVVFVSDRDQLKQLEREPESVLSMEEHCTKYRLTPSFGLYLIRLSNNLAKAEQLAFT